MTDDKSKIIIDEDWKAQVEREKREAAQKLEEQPVEAQPEFTLFDHLVSTFAAQTLMALGLIAPEGQTQVMVDLDHAKYLVDTLMMLQEKTQGNLTETESANLAEAVAELQRAFATRVEQARQAAAENIDLTRPDAP